MLKEVLTYTLTAVGGSTAFFLIAGFCFRKVINNLLNKDIEKYKTELKYQNENSLEKFKSSLKIEEIRFSKMHDKQAEVIAKLYAKLAVVLDQSKAYFSLISYEGGLTKDEIAKELAETVTAFMEYFNKHRIYLTETTCQKISGLYEKLYEHIIGFSFARNWAKEKDYSRGEAKKEEFKKWVEGFKALKKEGEIENILLDLETDFRHFLGVKF